MQPERWQQIDQLFHSALEQEPNRRLGFLLQECPSDESLRREVEALIASHEQAAGFIETPASDLAAELLAKGRSGLVEGQAVITPVLPSEGRTLPVDASRATSNTEHETSKVKNYKGPGAKTVNQ